MSALYGKGREAFLNGDIDWANDDIRCILVDTADYSVNIDVHDFLDDVPAGARVATSGAFTGKSSTLGVADAADVTFTAVTGDVSEALVIYKHTGVESTSALIAYIDSATGLPVIPNGSDIIITWDSGANKIFKL
jgi:hypothetical protein